MYDGLRRNLLHYVKFYIATVLPSVDPELETRNYKIIFLNVYIHLIK